MDNGGVVAKFIDRLNAKPRDSLRLLEELVRDSAVYDWALPGPQPQEAEIHSRANPQIVTRGKQAL